MRQTDIDTAWLRYLIDGGISECYPYSHYMKLALAALYIAHDIIMKTHAPTDYAASYSYLLLLIEFAQMDDEDESVL